MKKILSGIFLLLSVGLFAEEVRIEEMAITSEEVFSIQSENADVSQAIVNASIPNVITSGNGPAIIEGNNPSQFINASFPDTVVNGNFPNSPMGEDGSLNEGYLPLPQDLTR